MRKVLIVGDSPHLKTGFGRVNSIAADAFLSSGWEVGAVSGLTLDPPKSSDRDIRMFFPEQGDVLGVLAAGKAIIDWQPDLVYHTGEPGTLTAFSQVVPARLPFVAYVPIEGEPITNADWRTILNAATVFTCSKFGADVLKRDVGVDADWVYHGIDHDVFKVNGRRDDVRKMFGWTDKFVLITVATNVRRKQHPRLFEALSILKNRYKQNDIILYDHTIPFDGYWLEGWNLPQISYQLGVYEEVIFNPAMTRNNDAIPETAQYDGLGLVDLYNAADLFVLPSQVEGFGLPIAEAMACGVPVMVTKYAAGWEVAQPAGYPIPVKDWEVHKSGTRYANADVEALAKEILRIKRNPRGRSQRVDLGLRRVRDFSWEAYKEKLIAISERAYLEKTAPQEVSTSQAQESQDQSEEPSRQEVATSDGSNQIEVEDRAATVETVSAIKSQTDERPAKAGLQEHAPSAA